MRVADLIKKKGSSVVTLSPSATVQELLDTLDDHKIGAVVVLDDDAAVVGIVSERDVVHHLRVGSGLEAPVSELMTADVHSCTATDDLVQLATTMTERRLRHLPVVEDGSLRGIISIGDVVKARLDALEAERDHLESYLRQ
ncbi:MULTISPECIES: CBS domain-containing protein [unclassified Ornithinimicrobium]|uniref:CBS domain-containing protein n=1 Tax=unclassified Ornithinimicrobium TaxID=2615080 RepID=UPI003852AAFC